MSSIRLAQGLGWFSLALGALEMAAPGRLGGEMGLRRPLLLRAYGLREIAAGVGILASPKWSPTQTGFVWARVAGDVLDLATLALARPRSPAEMRGLAAAAAAVFGALALDVTCAAGLSKR
jgi:hypothetical protein